MHLRAFWRIRAISYWWALGRMCALLSSAVEQVDACNGAKGAWRCITSGVPTCRPRPSAASRLSSGMVYPFAFFQLEMQGGIFQSCACPLKDVSPCSPCRGQTEPSRP